MATSSRLAHESTPRARSLAADVPHNPPAVAAFHENAQQALLASAQLIAARSLETSR